jgi:hypothetical protein
MSEAFVQMGLNQCFLGGGQISTFFRFANYYFDTYKGFCEKNDPSSSDVKKIKI